MWPQGHPGSIPGPGMYFMKTREAGLLDTMIARTLPAFHMSSYSRSGAVTVLFLLVACSSHDRTARLPKTDSSAAPASSDQGPGCPSSLMTGDSIGPLHIGDTSTTARRACPVVRDTMMTVEYFAGPTRVLSFRLGRDVVVAPLSGERLSLIEVSSSRFRTPDSLGVGTTLGRLLRAPSVGAHFYDRRLYLHTASHCGIVFELAAPSVNLPEGDLDSARLARLPSSIVVDKVRVEGCSDSPLAVRDTNTAVRTDSVLLSRDLDGNGTTDFVVRESRLFDPRLGMRAYRLAVYLDSIPGHRAPAWATKWDEEFGGETLLGEPIALGSDASALLVEGGGGDYASETLLLVRHHAVRHLATHGEDYGNGYFEAKANGANLAIDASVDHLEIPGIQVPALTCSNQWEGVRLLYDVRAERFTAERPRCVKIPTQ